MVGSIMAAVRFNWFDVRIPPFPPHAACVNMTPNPSRFVPAASFLPYFGIHHDETADMSP